MRHKFNRLLELQTWAQKETNVIRNLLTSLVLHGQIVTTPKRAKVLKSWADKFFARMVGFGRNYAAADATRQAINLAKTTLYTEVAGKKAVNELVPKYTQAGKTAGFVADYKTTPRSGDNSMQVLVKLL